MTLTRDADDQIAIVEIKGRPNIIEIQGQLMDAVEFIKTENLKYALLDTRSMEGMFTLSLYWYRMRWLPLAKESGLKYLAVVLPSIFAPGKHIRRLNQSGDRLKDIQFQFFTEIDNARDWISSLN